MIAPNSKQEKAELLLFSKLRLTDYCHKKVNFYNKNKLFQLTQNSEPQKVDIS
jgi:hypothetical protein